MAGSTDRRYRLARIWSNAELRQIAGHVTGDVVNVSGWRDEDKEGGHYRDYFGAASSYRLTNYRADMRGWQDQEDEIFLDLEAPLPDQLKQSFDAVFNHTVLEHVYQIQTAFTNLCELSRDLVIVVVPFLQEMHGDYGDYWRFTPLALKRMFEANGLSLVRCSFNSHDQASVYILAVGSRQPERWTALANDFTCQDPMARPGQGSEMIGCQAIREPVGRRLRAWLRTRLRGSSA